jgi:hypothetical protein
LSFAAKPVGDRSVGVPRTSLGLTYKIYVVEFCDDPDGEPVVVPATGTPFTKLVNWHASKW